MHEYDEPYDRDRLRWMGHAARKPMTTMVKQLLFADSIPGRSKPWAMQDLNTLGPRLQLDLLRD